MADEPCSPWATPDDVAACTACSTDDLPPATLLEGLRVASAWLYRLDGRRYPGLCEATFRPIAECGCCGGYPYDGVGGWLYVDSRTGAVVRTGVGIEGRVREGAAEITLGVSPIRDVEITIDGAILSPSAYRIDDDAWLVRTDGQTWPHTNDLTLAPTEPGTWQIDVGYGEGPPYDGMVAARTLGIEVAKALCGHDCALPARVSSVARQGVTLTLMDPTDMLDNHRFGILAVDAYLESSNPDDLRRGSAFVNPDQMRKARRTTPFVGS